jgi:type 1 glutamine amidotransferase
MQKILLILSGWVHPPARGRLTLKQTLAELPGYSFDEASSLAEATPVLSAYKAVVLYYHHPKAALTDVELASFRSFVNDGGGVLAVHSATASYKSTPGYFEILGGRFTGHGPIEPIDVKPLQTDGGTFSGIPAFTVRDELYLHELQPDIEVHFAAEHRGESVPVVWTRNVGRGRVCYLCPGHRSESMRHATVRQIVQRGMKWVSGA